MAGLTLPSLASLPSINAFGGTNVGAKTSAVAPAAKTATQSTYQTNGLVDSPSQPNAGGSPVGVLAPKTSAASAFSSTAGQSALGGAVTKAATLTGALPSNLTPAQFQAITGQAPAAVLTPAQLAAQNAPKTAPTGNLATVPIQPQNGATGGTTDAQGNAVTAPAGAKQSANGLWYDSAGNSYTQGPNSSTGASSGSSATPSTVTLVNPDTGQEYTLNNPTADQISSFNSQGFQVAEGSGDGTGVISPTTTDPAIAAQQSAVSQAQADLASARSKLTNFDVSNDPTLTAQLASITDQWNQRIAMMSQVNDAQTAATRTSGIRNGDQYTGGSGGMFGGIITGEETAGVNRIASLETQKQQALSAATTAYSNQEWSRYSDLVNEADDAYKEQVSQLNTLQTNATKATEDAQTEMDKQNEDYYNEVTKPINDIADDAAKNGADAATVAAINASKTQGDAINAAGDWLQTATGDAGDYLQYKRDATAAGQTPVSFQSWESTNEYNKAFATAEGTAAGKASGSGSADSGVSQSDIKSKADLPRSVQPYAHQSANGTWYVDLSGVSEADRNDLAQAAGPDVPVITNADQAVDLTNIQDVTGKLKTIANVMKDQTNSNALSRDLGGAGLSTLAAIAQTNPQKAAAQALNDSALDVLKAISGVQGFRGNQAAINAVKESLPSITDTQDTAATKLSYIAQQIQDRETSILGTGGTTDNTNFVIRTESQAQDALTTAGKGNTDVQNNITTVLGAVNPATGQKYSYLEAAQILGIDIPALASQTSIFQGGTQLPNLWREISGSGI